MGRAHEVRAASMAKTAAVKSKLYSVYAKEIYQVAKTGGSNPDANPGLKRLIEKAKREQVPADVINRSIDKVNKGVTEDYQVVEYEGFGPGGSTIIVKCLTDNVNRSLSLVRPAFNKTNSKMGGINSVSFNYENLCVVGVKGKTEEEILDLMINNDIDVKDIELEDDILYIYGDPKDLFNIKNAITEDTPGIVFEVDEIGKYAKEMITLNDSDLEMFKKLLAILDDVEDVQTVYHNVSNV